MLTISVQKYTEEEVSEMILVQIYSLFPTPVKISWFEAEINYSKAWEKF